MLANGDSAGLCTVWRNMAYCALKTGDLRRASAIGARALALSSRLGRVEEQRNAAELLFKANEQLGDHRHALAHHKTYIAMRDSLQRTENQQEAIRQQFQYDFEKKEAVLKAEQVAKDAVADARIRSQRIAIMAMSGGGVMLLGLGTVGFLLYRQRERNKALAQRIAARDAERNRLSRELHDGVAGDLLGLQMAVDGGRAVNMHDELARLRDEVRHISHDLAMPDIANSSLPEMAHYLIGRWRHVGREMALFIDPQDDALWQLPNDTALHLYRILQEGLANALKHTAEDGQVKVELRRAQGHVNLTVENPVDTDRNATAPTGDGIGLRNVRERAQLINGRAELTLHEGRAQLEVSVPV